MRQNFKKNYVFNFQQKLWVNVFLQETELYQIYVPILSDIGQEDCPPEICAENPYLCVKRVFTASRQFYISIPAQNAPSRNFHCTNKFQKGVNRQCAPKKCSTFISFLFTTLLQSLYHKIITYIHHIDPQKINRLTFRYLIPSSAKCSKLELIL